MQELLDRLNVETCPHCGHFRDKKTKKHTHDYQITRDCEERF